MSVTVSFTDKEILFLYRNYLIPLFDEQWDKIAPSDYDNYGTHKNIKKKLSKAVSKISHTTK